MNLEITIRVPLTGRVDADDVDIDVGRHDAQQQDAAPPPPPVVERAATGDAGTRPADDTDLGPAPDLPGPPSLEELGIAAPVSQPEPEPPSVETIARLVTSTSTVPPGLEGLSLPNGGVQVAAPPDLPDLGAIDLGVMPEMVPPPLSEVDPSASRRKKRATQPSGEA